MSDWTAVLRDCEGAEVDRLEADTFEEIKGQMNQLQGNPDRWFAVKKVEISSGGKTLHVAFD